MSNYCKHGQDHYSYETCIRTTLADGTTVGNITKYSPTTSKHQNYSHANVRGCEILVDGVPRGTTDAGLRVIAKMKVL